MPILYLRGLSTGDFGPALSTLLGEEALAGFSATTVTRLLPVWQDEYKAWANVRLRARTTSISWPIVFTSTSAWKMIAWPA
ncbi:MAG TPA: hypothetical protein VFI27_12310 [candidate division Zixibacteria bacterium]|nr:hypothetical protein [candidate division Zixibacteria bacterium]